MIKRQGPILSRPTKFIIALYLLATTSVAQGASVIGTISDANAKPVSRVKIFVKSPSGKTLATAQTDVQGHYEINGLAPTIYNFVLVAASATLNGGNATAYLNADGLTIDWILSSNPAVAVANRGTGSRSLASKPWGLSNKNFNLLVAGGTVTPNSGSSDRCQVGACFSGISSGPSM
jgi:hypothetical protein